MEAYAKVIALGKHFSPVKPSKKKAGRSSKGSHASKKTNDKTSNMVQPLKYNSADALSGSTTLSNSVGPDKHVFSQSQSSIPSDLPDNNLGKLKDDIGSGSFKNIAKSMQDIARRSQHELERNASLDTSRTAYSQDALERKVIEKNEMHVELHEEPSIAADPMPSAFKSIDSLAPAASQTTIHHGRVIQPAAEIGSIRHSEPQATGNTDQMDTVINNHLATHLKSKLSLFAKESSECSSLEKKFVWDVHTPIENSKGHIFGLKRENSNFLFPPLQHSKGKLLPYCKIPGCAQDCPKCISIKGEESSIIKHIIKHGIPLRPSCNAEKSKA
jgi:hypothetical protein